MRRIKRLFDIAHDALLSLLVPPLGYDPSPTDFQSIASTRLA